MKTSYILIPGIILAIAITGFGLYLWQEQTERNNDRDSSPIATVTPTPTPAPSISPTNQPSASQTPSPVSQDVQLFLVAIDDSTAGKEIGCGDGLVGVTKNINTTQPLAESIRQLLAIKDEFYGQSGLYNALWQSSLSVESVSIQNGTATIKLTGEIKLSGTCDSPRVEEQLKATATQFDTVDTVNITLNNQPLSQALSAK